MNETTRYILFMNMEMTRKRGEMYRSIRSWLDERGYLEVFTPSLSTHLIPEHSIANFSTRYLSEFRPSKELYLIPSPEVFMKQILREYQHNIYQISTCFRNDEQIGDHHNPEFTMLEYYTVGADDEDSIAITEELLRETSLKGTREHALPPFRRMSVAEACMQYAGVDLLKTQRVGDLRQAALNLGLTLPPSPETWEETFHRIFLTFVEPNLPQDKPLVLTDYPSQIDTLAKKVPGKPYRRRWEMYIAGVEIANCYDEELERDTVRAFYEKEYAILCEQRGRDGSVIPDIDYSFAELFDGHFPQASGVAMGLDRLLMVQTGATSLRDLILFRVSDMMKHYY